MTIIISVLLDGRTCKRPLHSITWKHDNDVGDITWHLNMGFPEGVGSADRWPLALSQLTPLGCAMCHRAGTAQTVPFSLPTAPEPAVGAVTAPGHQGTEWAVLLLPPLPLALCSSPCLLLAFQPS